LLGKLAVVDVKLIMMPLYPPEPGYLKDQPPGLASLILGLLSSSAAVGVLLRIFWTVLRLGRWPSTRGRWRRGTPRRGSSELSWRQKTERQFIHEEVSRMKEHTKKLEA
jgi:hypothetical protein